MNSYKELIVWQKSMELVEEIYKLVSLLPKDELYGLSSQMKRAAVSIPSNIAEGFRRNHRTERMQFWATSYGSGGELETQLEIGRRLKYFTDKQMQKAEQLLDEVMRVLNSMRQK